MPHLPHAHISDETHRVTTFELLYREVRHRVRGAQAAGPEG
ncbi:hypothetical protein [Arthrobacter sp. zg-Y844]|nr:hypothetical protein [Arthrobacter sp. zg-Y844]